MKKININQFVNDYLATAAWVTCDSDENKNFTREAKKAAKSACGLFITKVIDKFGIRKATELLTIPGNDLGYLAPHDFFLTRNGHGTGFWDRDGIYGDNEARVLVDISKSMGGTDCYHLLGPKSKLTFD